MRFDAQKEGTIVPQAGTMTRYFWSISRQAYPLVAKEKTITSYVWTLTRGDGRVRGDSGRLRGKRERSSALSPDECEECSLLRGERSLFCDASTVLRGRKRRRRGRCPGSCGMNGLTRGDSPRISRQSGRWCGGSPGTRGHRQGMRGRRRLLCGQCPGTARRWGRRQGTRGRFSGDNGCVFRVRNLS